MDETITTDREDSRECDECGWIPNAGARVGDECIKCPGHIRRVTPSRAERPSESSSDADADRGYALALLPLAKEIVAFVKDRIPPDTEYAVLLVPATTDQHGLKRTVAISSNRDRMSFYAAQWALDVHSQNENKSDAR